MFAANLTIQIAIFWYVWNSLSGLIEQIRASDVSEKDIIYLIASMVNSKSFRKVKGISDYKHVYRLFQKVLYNYSKKNMQMLCNNPVFGQLFLFYLQSYWFDYFLQSDETMKRNQQQFRKMAEEVWIWIFEAQK